MSNQGIAEEIRELLESKQYIVDGEKHRRIIRSLLEENDILRDIHATMNMEDELERKRLKDEVRSLRSELAAMKNVMKDIKYQIEQSNHPAGLGILAAINATINESGEEQK